MFSSAPLPSLLLIPTGIGCEVGGYAGDAIPSARLLAEASGCLITHPNVMNGASLYWNDDRIQYVEGFSIDRFACGEILLHPVRSQRVGVLFDAGLEGDLRQRHLQVIDACSTSLGINIGPIVTTDFPVGISFRRCSSGSSGGGISSPDALLRAGKILQEEGASAIAVVTRFPDDFEQKELDAYRQGKGVDVIAGAESIISHFLVKHLHIPCAHAPALSALPIANFLDPRAAAEELAHTFLSCVLVGLSRAPDLIPLNAANTITNISRDRLISIDQLGAVVVPQGALGGEAVLGCIERDIPLVVVTNPSVLKVDLNSFGLQVDSQQTNHVKVFTARNYIEAAGILLALRQGISIHSLKRPVQQIKQI